VCGPLPQPFALFKTYVKAIVKGFLLMVISIDDEKVPVASSKKKYAKYKSKPYPI